MKIAVSIDKSGLEKRIVAMDFEKNCALLLRDAAIFMAEKIRANLISGRPYVGVRTGNLRANTIAKVQSNTKAVVWSQMPYTQFVLAWSKSKYGDAYNEAAVRLYGNLVQNLIGKEIGRICALHHYSYQSPF